MAVQDLIPTAVSIKKSLLGQGSSIPFRAGFSTTPVDSMWQFLAGIYAKQEAITKVEAWNYTTVDGATVVDKYNQVRAQYPDYIGPFVVASQLEWDKLQTAIDTVISIMDPIEYISLLPRNTQLFLDNAGMFQRPMIGLVPDTNLYAANGTILTTGVVSDDQYALKWAQLRVPYDRNTLGVNTAFISRLTGPNHATYFRYTGSVYWLTTM